MLKMKKLESQLMPDPDMYIFFEKGIGGGISYISNRYSKANIYLRYYNPKQEPEHSNKYISKNIQTY